jgi:predicted HD phosphohydrolase
MNERTTRSRVRNNSHFAHAAFVATFEPKDIGHALSDYNWVNSMHEELENFERNQVWELVTLPHGVSRLVLLTQNQHLAPNTQQAERSWLNTRAGSESVPVNFPETDKG